MNTDKYEKIELQSGRTTVTNEKGETGNGTGKYVNFKVEYKNVKIPDSIPINEGDKVVFTMPKEVSFRTDFDFDVK